MQPEGCYSTYWVISAKLYGLTKHFRYQFPDSLYTMVMMKNDQGGNVHNENPSVIKQRQLTDPLGVLSDININLL